LVASADHVWHDEIFRRLDRLGAIVLPAVVIYEAREVIECHSEWLDLVILEEPFGVILSELTELRDLRPELHILGCAYDKKTQARFIQDGCTEIDSMMGRSLMERIARIITEIQGHLTVH
jgi:hypothetical protein